MGEEAELAGTGAVWIAGPVESLMDTLLEEHGFEERSMMVSDGISVPDGLYVQRTELGGLLVWVPPDPSRTWGDPAILPRAVRVRAESHGEGTRLELRRVTAPATRVGVGAAMGLTLVAVTVAAAIGGAVAWSILGVLGAVFWGELLMQLRVARARSQAAWDALQPALQTLALPEPPRASPDPYR